MASALSQGAASREQIRAGFIPLLDAAPLIAAARLGFGEAEGLRIRLVRETSWATLRDRIAVRHLDVAHMLGPMPIADRLGLSPLPGDLVAPMAMGFGGNTITVSASLWSAMQETADLPPLDPQAAGRALTAVASSRRERRQTPPVLAIVHPFSAHHYQLAYWLAANGVDPIRDVELVVIPPSLMPAALGAQQIDGFCAGEPWGSLAVAETGGHIVTTGSRIWASSPEKVLGTRLEWIDEAPERLYRLMRALYRAAVWCDQPENKRALAELLSASDLLGLPSRYLLAGLERRLEGVEAAGPGDGFLTFAAHAATFPWQSHASLLYAQMVRLGQVRHQAGNLARARAAYRPDLYRAGLAATDVPFPDQDTRIEGALVTDTVIDSLRGPISLGRNAFCDGALFDPDDPRSYDAVASPASA